MSQVLLSLWCAIASAGESSAGESECFVVVRIQDERWLSHLLLLGRRLGGSLIPPPERLLGDSAEKCGYSLINRGK